MQCSVVGTGTRMFKVEKGRQQDALTHTPYIQSRSTIPEQMYSFIQLSDRQLQNCFGVIELQCTIK